MGDGSASLALGIMVQPSNGASRAAIRATWLPEARQHAAVRFVAGDVPCARRALQGEADAMGDVSFVKSDDCQKWHSPAKVHAWYQHALDAFPRAAWIAKMEDDGLLWTSALVHDLAALSRNDAYLHHGMVYVGMMQWVGSCTDGVSAAAAAAARGVRGVRAHIGGKAAGSAAHVASESVPSALGYTPSPTQECRGCWGGWYRAGAPAPSACPTLWRRNWAGSVREGTSDCPAFRLAPFACGPFEARSRPLAAAVGRCAYASSYFPQMSRRGDARKNYCTSADGGQGHAIGHCVRSIGVADLGLARQRYATFAQMNLSQAIIVHPIKPKGAEFNAAAVPRLVGEWKRVWEFMRRAPYAPQPLHVSRVSRFNQTQPLVERMGRVDFANLGLGSSRLPRRGVAALGAFGNSSAPSRHR